MTFQTMHKRSGTCHESRKSVPPTTTWRPPLLLLPPDDCKDAVRGSRCCSSCRTSTTRVLDAELTAAHREPSRRSGRRSVCCRATTRSSAGRSAIVRTTSTTMRSSRSSASRSSSTTPRTSSAHHRQYNREAGDMTRKLNSLLQAPTLPFQPDDVHGHDK